MLFGINDKFKNNPKVELQDEGYVLLCQAYPKSDLKIIANQFDAVWEQR